ncbi:MAG: transposase [Desulfobulbaceae bacterium]|nr:transposase [Desulfobulbaceae bacterium]
MARDDTKGQEELARLLFADKRACETSFLFPSKKLHYQQKTGQVISRSKLSNNKNKRSFEVFPVLDFIAAITRHIPAPPFQLVRYYGCYSNRMRGDEEPWVDVRSL